MPSILPDPAPDFDQPIAVLKHCHGRIRKQLLTLEKLLAHLPAHGADQGAQEAATAVMRYFDKAAPLHHDDEEQDLLPMLQATASGADAGALQALAPSIVQDHKDMDALWQDLHEQLAAIAQARASYLSSSQTSRFIECYGAHMEREEAVIAPMALRLFSPEQMATLAQAMRRRRGLETAATAVPALGQAVADLRIDYGQATLAEDEVLADPIAQFTVWFEQALKAEVNEPNAMTLATANAAGQPSARIVLIKQFDARGFTWYTNYASHKGSDLRDNNQAALLFFWSELERQIRIEGKVERVDAEESDRYFRSRPLKSRLAAIASQQSRPIANRTELEHNYESVANTAGDDPERPEHWGGYRLIPERIEFWQGRRSRFHDRVLYVRQEDGSWLRQRLQP